MCVKDCLYAATITLNQIFINYLYFNPNFQKWLHKETSRFISLAIQNENLKDMAMYILRSIVKNIKDSSYYNIIADETTDTTNKEQLVIYIRWVDSDLNETNALLG